MRSTIDAAPQTVGDAKAQGICRQVVADCLGHHRDAGEERVPRNRDGERTRRRTSENPNDSTAETASPASAR